MRCKTMITAAITAGMATLGTAAHAQQTKVLFNSFLQPKHVFNTEVLHPWLADVTKATGGRVTFEVPPTSLAAPQQQMDGVAKGVMDAAYMFHGFLAERVKLAQVSHLPWGSTTAHANSIALWRTHVKYFAAADEYKDVHLVALFVFPAGQVYSMKEPVKSLGDFKGAKWYGLPGVPAKILEFAGAGVVTAPAVRSFEIISAGTVDGFAGYSMQDARTFHTLQFAKSIVEIPGDLSSPSFALFINKKKWSSLPQPDREILAKMAGEAFAMRMGPINVAEERAKAEAMQKGVQFHRASDAFVAELEKIAQPLEAAWLADAAKLSVDGKAALAYYREESRKIVK